MPRLDWGLYQSSLYATSPRFHTQQSVLDDLLAAREQQLQQLMHHQTHLRQAAAAAAASSSSAASAASWVQTNESVAEASPTRSLRVLHTGVGPIMESVAQPPRVAAAAAASPSSLHAKPSPSSGGGDRTAYEARGTFIDEITELDILCGRGGRSNHWPGNKRYRRVISDMKAAYKSSEGRKGKTGLSRTIVEHVLGYGGRFVREEDESGRYYVLTKAEARVKTSQALREGKDLKWTG